MCKYDVMIFMRSISCTECQSDKHQVVQNMCITFDYVLMTVFVCHFRKYRRR